MSVETTIGDRKVSFPITRNGEFIMVGEHFIPNYEDINLQDYLYPEHVDGELITDIGIVNTFTTDKLVSENVLSSEDIYLMNQQLITNYNSIVELVRKECKKCTFEEIILQLRELRFGFVKSNYYLGKLLKECTEEMLE